MRIRVVSAFIVAFSFAVLAYGGQDPNNARGVEAGKLYSFSNLDTVNTFNGNLIVQLPIGQSYPVSSSLSYHLQLTYNSKIWDYAFIHYEEPEKPAFQRRAVPERDSNAGLGWSLSLGRILPPRQGTATTEDEPWTYVAPDGSRHTIGGKDPYTVETYGYTDDGSFIRYKHTSASHELHFPNGQVHAFHADGRLREISDPFGNWIRADYGTTPAGAELWTITDGHGTTALRSHTVAFERVPDATTRYPDNPNFKQRVKTVSLAAFPQAGETAATARAEYTFHYLDTAIERGGCGAWLEGLSTTSNVPLLTAIDLPDGTAYRAQYNTTDVPPCSSGTINRLSLPTFGRIDWKFGVYELSASDCRIDPLGEPGRKLWSYDQVGVRERTFTAGDASPAVTWKYEPQLVPGETLSNVKCDKTFHPQLAGPPQVFTNTITTPSGQKIKHYFSALLAESPVRSYEGPNKLADYGLPFTRGDASGIFFLSEETSDLTGTVLRRKYVRYDSAPNSMWLNRPAGARTIFVRDWGCGTSGTAQCYSDSDSTDYDGYGHYRKLVESSNFGPVRTTAVDYNGSAAAPRSIATHQPWILNVYTKRTVTEAGPVDVAPSVRETRVCIDPSTGVVKGRRTLKEANTGTSDVIVRYTYDGKGDVTIEDWYGGDRAPLSSADLCSYNGAGASEYQIIRTYSAGVLATEKYRGASSLTVDNTVETNTGHVRSSRDSAGVESTFTYDRSGRLTSSLPGGGVETTYEYRPAYITGSGAINPPALFTRHDNAQGTGRATKVEFDGLGRIRVEGELMPKRTPDAAEEWSYRYRTYDGAGRIAKETVAGTAAESALAATTFKYDTFDRAVEVMAPDFSRTYTTYPGDGGRVTKRTSFIRLPHADAPADVTEVRDAFGRLIEVAESSGPTTASSATGAVVKTRYSYDAGDQLRLVRMAGTETVQTRIFDYDGRGFLRWEMQPESGMKSYSYDSRGKILSRRLSEAGSPYDLELTYDSSERLIEVAGRNPFPGAENPLPELRSEFRPLKSFVFADSNISGDFSKGKLSVATRYNYPPVSSATGGEVIKIVERYYYVSPHGLATDRITDVWSNKLAWGQFTKHSSVELSRDHDAYGQLWRVSYPKVLGSALPASRTVAYDYARGRLTKVSNGHTAAPYASITYHGNGMRDTIAHSNGMADTQEVDSSGIPRPRRMTSGPSTLTCTAPTIVEQPVGAKIGPGQGVTLRVLATGTAPLTYQWWDATSAPATEITGAIAETHWAAPSTTGRYYVTVSSPCKTVTSFTVVVSVDSCPAVRVFAERAINKDGSVTLSARPDGAGTIACNWYRADGTLLGTGTTLSVSNAVGLQAIEVRASTDCGGAAGTAWLPDMTAAHVVTSLAATLAPDRTKIVVTWPAIAGKTSYLLNRSSAAGHQSYEVTGTVFEDVAIAAGAVYAYSLGGAIANGNTRPVVGNVDLATTLTFSPVAPATLVEPKYFDELLAAVNAVRAVAGWPKLTWQTVMPPSVPVPASGTGIHSFYLTALRPRMDEALQALGASARPYSDPDPKLVAIKALHVIEMQGRAQ